MKSIPLAIATLLPMAAVLVVAGCRSGGQAPSRSGQAAPPAGQVQTQRSGETAAAPGGQIEAGQASPQEAAPPIAVSAQPGSLQRGLEAGKTYELGASGRNANVQLTVADLKILTAIGGSQAPPGTQYVVLSTAWKNLVQPKTVQRPKSAGRTGIVGGSEMETVVVETPYLVQTLAEHLYLLIDGRYVAEVSPASEQLPDHLPLTGLLIERYKDEVRGTVAFSISAEMTQSLTLRFFDFTHGHISLPLYGKVPSAQDKPAAGPARNQLFEAAAYRTEFVKKVGQPEAPTGRQYLVVHFGASSVVPGAATQLDFSQYAFLIEDEVYQSQPVKDLTGVPHLFGGLVRFIPGFVRHGVIVFEVPEQPGRMELLLAASMMDPVSFVLTPTVQAKAQPRPVRTIQDGDSAEVLINSATWTDRLGDAPAPEGRRFLILDVTVRNKEVRQGLIVQPVQLVLTDGRATFSASSATQKLAHPLIGERVVPAGKKSRFEIAIEAPKDAQGLRLRYQGFTKIEEVPLP